MLHLLETLPNPAIIAHRGASRYAPENTLAAFRLAIEQRADGIEFDVRLTADDHIVVIHDASVSRTTNGHGWVGHLPLEKLQNLDAGQGEKIPTLDEVFESVDKSLLINIELKPILTHTKRLSEKVAYTVRQHQAEKSVICSSFSLVALKALASYAPEIPIGLLLPGGYIPSRIITRAGRKLIYQTLHPDYHDVLTGNIVPKSSTSQNIFPYTANEEVDMRQLFDLGVAGIFTDDPLLAKRVRGF